MYLPNLNDGETVNCLERDAAQTLSKKSLASEEVLCMLCRKRLLAHKHYDHFSDFELCFAKKHRDECDSLARWLLEHEL